MSEMKDFYKNVETWFKEQLKTAPLGLRNGWFISDLGFFDLQSALSEGTEAAIALSMTVALVVVFLTTLNLFVSLFTVLTIAACIFVTVSNHQSRISENFNPKKNKKFSRLVYLC